VGLTRAKEKVYMSSAARRRVFGKEERPAPSRFLSEIPKELVEWKNFYGTTYGEFTERDSYTDRSERRESPDKSRSDENGSRYKVGQRIEHPSFGRGTIKRVEGTGEKARVTVLFPGYGIKKIIASYLEG
jgi:DNA helicase-2/ATP-dependent DNA helicase PcrA